MSKGLNASNQHWVAENLWEWGEKAGYARWGWSLAKGGGGPKGYNIWVFIVKWATRIAVGWTTGSQKKRDDHACLESANDSTESVV